MNESIPYTSDAYVDTDAVAVSGRGSGRMPSAASMGDGDEDDGRTIPWLWISAEIGRAHV